MKGILTAIILLAIIQGAVAQSDFVSTNAGDTIYGKINFDTPTDLSETVTVKNENGKQTISSSKIVCVQSKGKTYKSIRYGTKYRIMQEIVPGYLTLFKYRDGGFEFATNFLYKVTGEGLATSPITFRRTVAEFLKECSEISNAILEKEYSFRDINKVVSDYNNTCLREVAPAPMIANATSQESQVDLEELHSLLGDILSRKEKGEQVPAYLKKALKEYADKDVKAALLQLVNSLEN